MSSPLLEQFCSMIIYKGQAKVRLELAKASEKSHFFTCTSVLGKCIVSLRNEGFNDNSLKFWANVNMVH